MNGKRLIIVMLILLIIGGVIFFCTRNRQEEVVQGEITPEEEISEEQERKTMISLYFKDKQTGELTKENRMIDVKVLAENPYKALVEMLIEGPKTEKLQSTIPDGTRINDISINGECIHIDLSKEFINNHEGGLDNESKTIYSIVNTLTELNEVNFVRIFIDGEENLGFQDGNMNFQENFQRND
ncbi:MAG: GerMN domain-containing protein [Clostridia bacterium]|nr:GerMN domain-containing protein [Clostridia bacterium]